MIRISIHVLFLSAFFYTTLCSQNNGRFDSIPAAPSAFSIPSIQEVTATKTITKKARRPRSTRKNPSLAMSLPTEPIKDIVRLPSMAYIYHFIGDYEVYHIPTEAVEEDKQIYWNLETNAAQISAAAKIAEECFKTRSKTAEQTFMMELGLRESSMFYEKLSTLSPTSAYYVFARGTEVLVNQWTEFINSALLDVTIFHRLKYSPESELRKNDEKFHIMIRDLIKLMKKQIRLMVKSLGGVETFSEISIEEFKSKIFKAQIYLERILNLLNYFHAWHNKTSLGKWISRSRVRDLKTSGDKIKVAFQKVAPHFPVDSEVKDDRSLFLRIEELAAEIYSALKVAKEFLNPEISSFLREKTLEKSAEKINELSEKFSQLSPLSTFHKSAKITKKLVDSWDKCIKDVLQKNYTSQSTPFQHLDFQLAELKGGDDLFKREIESRIFNIVAELKQILLMISVGSTQYRTALISKSLEQKRIASLLLSYYNDFIPSDGSMDTCQKDLDNLMNEILAASKIEIPHEVLQPEPAEITVEKENSLLSLENQIQGQHTCPSSEMTIKIGSFEVSPSKTITKKARRSRSTRKKPSLAISLPTEPIKEIVSLPSVAYMYQFVENYEVYYIPTEAVVEDKQIYWNLETNAAQVSAAAKIAEKCFKNKRKTAEQTFMMELGLKESSMFYEKLSFLSPTSAYYESAKSTEALLNQWTEFINSALQDITIFHSLEYGPKFELRKKDNNFHSAMKDLIILMKKQVGAMVKSLGGVETFSEISIEEFKSKIFKAQIFLERIFNLLNYLHAWQNETSLGKWISRSRVRDLKKSEDKIIAVYARLDQYLNVIFGGAENPQ